MSHSLVTTVTDEGFKPLPSLSNIDLRGCPLTRFPSDLFHGLMQLRVIRADNYKVCCPPTLPLGFEGDFCFAPQNEVSSCDDLLRSDTYRIFLWIMSLLSLTGNVGSFVFRLLIQKRSSKTGFNVFVTQLNVADVFMGVYLAMIGVADSVYRNKYLLYDMVWMSSTACRMAGFFCLMSSEVSAFIICLITLDRFIVLHFPFSQLRLQPRSAAVSAGLAWVTGILLAAVPLLSVTSHWRFYSQTGICIPLPITRQDFEGRDYSFAVIIVFNFILFLFIAAGQGFVFWIIKVNSMSATNTTNKSNDLTVARRLLTVVVSDFVCWFPVGLLGLLASCGVAVPNEVNVAMAIFVLPLNSALNPFLYTFNMLMERRRKRKEAELIKWLESRVLTKRQKATTSEGDVGHYGQHNRQQVTLPGGSVGLCDQHNRQQVTLPGGSVCLCDQHNRQQVTLPGGSVGLCDQHNRQQVTLPGGSVGLCDQHNRQ